MVGTANAVVAVAKTHMDVGCLHVPLRAVLDDVGDEGLWGFGSDGDDNAEEPVLVDAADEGVK